MDAILPEHWNEIALNKDTVKLAVDYERYEKHERAGALFVLTVRSAGELVGYYVAFIGTHMHYKHDLMAFTDIYYLRKPYRRGRTGIEMLRRAEAELKRMGVVKIVSMTKLHLDMGKLFKRLGWQETERVFTKYIGE